MFKIVRQFNKPLKKFANLFPILCFQGKTKTRQNFRLPNLVFAMVFTLKKKIKSPFKVSWTCVFFDIGEVYFPIMKKEPTERF